MHQQNIAILKGLVPIAWADGTYADQERQVIDALLEAFEALPDEAEAFRLYAETPRTIDDVPVTDLSYDDRRVLLQHAVFLSFADGDYSEQESTLVKQLANHLRVPDEEAKSIIEAASERAKRHRDKLDS